MNNHNVEVKESMYELTFHSMNGKNLAIPAPLKMISLQSSITFVDIGMSFEDPYMRYLCRLKHSDI